MLSSATRRFWADNAAIEADCEADAAEGSIGEPVSGVLEAAIGITTLDYSWPRGRVQPGDAEGVGLPG
jgi:hypothetical protein